MLDLAASGRLSPESSAAFLELLLAEAPLRRRVRRFSLPVTPEEMVVLRDPHGLRAARIGILSRLVGMRPNKVARFFDTGRGSDTVRGRIEAALAEHDVPPRTLTAPPRGNTLPRA